MSTAGPSATPLRHNPLNAVTATVERIAYADGRTASARSCGRRSVQPGPWAGSTEHRGTGTTGAASSMPTTTTSCAPRLADAGLGAAGGRSRGDADGAVLCSRTSPGRPGRSSISTDHAALARACGRWQAAPPGTGRGRRRVPARLLDDRRVPWELSTTTRPGSSRWSRSPGRPSCARPGRSCWLIGTSCSSWSTARRAAGCHLDLWVSNVIQRPTGELALLDWAFTGDGALGEDIGNHIPDAVFDLFWPAERLPELAETCIDNYLDGLREAGWRGDPDRAPVGDGVRREVRLVAALLLERAAGDVHRAYHEQVDSRHLFHQRGLALAFVAAGCAEALRRSGR